MKAHPVRVHAFRVNGVTAELARHGADRVRDRLLDERFGLAAFSAPAFLSRPLAFRPFAAGRPHPAAAARSRVKRTVRVHILPSIIAGRLAWKPAGRLRPIPPAHGFAGLFSRYCLSSA